FAASFSLLARRGQRHGSAVTGVVIGLIVNTPFLIAATVYFWEPGWWDLRSILLFAVGGMTGPAVGRVFMYQAIHYLGVSRAMPLMATLPLFTAVLAYGFLGERPGPYIWAGTVLIVAGCAGVMMKKKSDTSWERRFLWLSFISILGFAISNIFRKVGLTDLPSPLMGVTVTYISGLIFLLLIARFLPPGHRPQLRWGKAWYFYGACGVLNTMAFLSHFFAIRYGDLTIVSPLSAMSPVFALLLSWFFLRDIERVTGWILAGTALAVAGGILIAWRIL
ncbi:MAG: DMT family transporter, partial [bacterium]